MTIDLFSVSIGIPGIILVIIGTILMLKYRNEYPTIDAITKYERNYIDKWGAKDPEINKRSTRTVKTPGTISFGTTDAMDKFWKYWDRRKNIGIYIIIIGLCFQGILVSYEIFYEPSVEQFGFPVEEIPDCPESHVVYENNCVGVASANMIIFDSGIFFRAINGTIIEYCEVEFKEGKTLENCKQIPSYHITEFNEIIIQWDYQDWNKENESKELQCLKLYKEIKELSVTPEMLTAERETIKQQKDQIIKYVENNCPDFKDLDLMYDNFVNIP